MNIIWPSNTREIIDEIRGTIGRDVTIHYTTSGVPCTTCQLDSLTGKSFDPFCPDCGGTGIVTSGLDTTVSGHVLWNKVNSKYNSPAGNIFTGDCKVTVGYDEEVLTIIESSEYFLVDDVRLYLEDYDLRGVKEINRIAISLRQDPREER
jgi:hypothetical protein